MTRTLRRFVVVLVVALALFGVFASCAFASLEDTPTTWPALATTSSNPGAGADFWWRDGWGNTLYPDFELQPPGVWDPVNDGYLLGTIYAVDRNAAPARSSYINTGTPSSYYRDAFPTANNAIGGTLTDNTLDMLGIYLNPLSGSWPAPPSGATSPLEGDWYYHYAFYSDQRYQNDSYTLGFGIDLTPPRAVTGLHIKTGLTGSDVATWQPATRAVISWDASQTDSLSGDGYFQVLVDDKPFVPEASATPELGRAYAAPGVPGPSQITIESMPPGYHKVSIQPVDRATNVGPTTSAYWWSDPDTPTISWADPVGSVLDPRSGAMSVDASDLAGDPVVNFTLNGSAAGTVTAPPYTVTPAALSSLATGTYTISATVTDHLNRKVTISKSVQWNPHGLAGSVVDSSLDPTSTVIDAPDSAETSTGGGTGWTNNLMPVAMLSAPDNASDLFYKVTQTPVDIDTSNLLNYYHSTMPLGTLLDQKVNIKDTVDSGGPWAPVTGASNKYEGPWYFQWVWYDRDNSHTSTHTFRARFNVDQTPPTQVTGFSANPSAGTWTEARRVNLTWDAKQYDALSGDLYYQISIDGTPAVSVNATSVYSNSATIEDMPAGRHKISISAVDKAGNVGPSSDLYFESDPAAPTASWNLPSDPNMNPRNSLIYVDAADDAGDPTVTFQIDGGMTQSVTAPPYAILPNLAGLTAGPHTLTATVIDKFGHTVVLTKTITWSASIPLISDPAVDLTGSMGTSRTNPGALDEADSWWRQGWGNSLYPNLNLNPPSPDAQTYGLLVGMLYNVTTSPSDINTSTPAAYYRAARGTGTNLDQTIDMQGIYNFPPLGGWRSSPVPGATSAIEGPWYMNLIWLTAGGYTGTQTYHIPIGIDITPPSAVESMVVSPSSNPADATGTITTSRINISWKDKEYDALSGTAYFQVLIDGQKAVPESDSNPAQGRVFNLPGASASSVAIESLPAGKHDIGIAAVDRATNMGPVVTRTIWSDPDTPTIAWASTSTAVISARDTLISVLASDAAGEAPVTISLGTTATPSMVATTIPSGPYDWSPDLSALPAGTYMLEATVTDHAKRSVTISKPITWVPRQLLLSNSAVDLTTNVIGTTPTNPNALDGADSWWRQGWGNSLYPEFDLVPPSPDAKTYGLVVGMLYDLTTAPSDIDTSTPEAYYRAARGTGTNLDQSIDMQGIYNFPPLGGWRAAPLPGATSGIEGPWYMNLIWLTAGGYTGTQTYHVPIGIDVTPPSAVDSMVVSPSLDPATATDTITTSRINISWKPKEYDALSGTAYYQILIDGANTVPESDSNPVQGRVFNLPGAPASSVAIENLPPGKHEIGLAAVDRATNMGPVSTKIIWSDPDTPTISWTSTGTTVLDPSNPQISVNATDASGEAIVTMSLGTTATPSILTTTVASAPYTWVPDTSSLATGTYTITATVRDHAHRAVTITRQMTWTPHSLAASVDPSLGSSGISVSAPDSAESSTGANPDGYGWTNNLYPIVGLTLPPGVNDTFYNIVQTPSNIDNLNLQNYFHSVDPDKHADPPNGTLFDQTVDLKDTIDGGLGSWLAGPVGSVAPYEGTWYLQWVDYSDPGLLTPPTVSPTMRVKFQIDRTPPAIVTGYSLTPASATWTTSRRVQLKWDAKEYDALSKDALYRVFIDGVRSVDVSSTCPVAGTLTIEDMPSGKHKVSIAAVDKAGNVGPLNDLWYYGDHSAPMVSISQPTTGTLTPKSHTISVDASDDAGDPTVVIDIYPVSHPASATVLATLSSAPYTISPDLTGFATGSYTLRATATDGMGNSAVATKDVFIDNTVTLAPDTAVDLPDGASIGTSKSNPGLDTDMETWWRQGWGNSLTPDFELNVPSPTASTYGLVIGTLYSISTTPQDVNPGAPDNYFRAARGTGTNLNQTIDMQGVFNYPPVGGWRVGPVPGATLPIEGQWYMNLRWFTSKGFTSSRTYSIPMGIDLTPPSAIASMVVSPSLNTADATDTIPTSRIHISWAPKEYDALSGVAYYQVYIDGVAAVPESDSNPAQGRVYEVPGVTPSSVTIENLSAGRHTIGLAAVDRATNVGPVSTKVIYCDPDVPVVAITSPTGSTIGVRPTVTAAATDKGGITHVDFALDGTPIGTDDTAPYSQAVDLSGFSAGAHTLTATAYDHYGRAVTASKTVTVDKTPLTVSSIKTSGSGRKVTISYKVNRAASVKISLATAATSSTKIASAAGTYTFTYTYPKGKKYPSSLSFNDTFTLKATDSLGNVVTSTGKVKVTLARIVKLAGNKIKIIYY